MRSFHILFLFLSVSTIVNAKPNGKKYFITYFKPRENHIGVYDPVRQYPQRKDLRTRIVEGLKRVASTRQSFPIQQNGGVLDNRPQLATNVPQTTFQSIASGFQAFTTSLFNFLSGGGNLDDPELNEFENVLNSLTDTSGLEDQNATNPPPGMNGPNCPNYPYYNQNPDYGPNYGWNYVPNCSPYPNYVQADSFPTLNAMPFNPNNQQFQNGNLPTVVLQYPQYPAVNAQYPAVNPQYPPTNLQYRPGNLQYPPGNLQYSTGTPLSQPVNNQYPPVNIQTPPGNYQYSQGNQQYSQGNQQYLQANQQYSQGNQQYSQGNQQHLQANQQYSQGNQQYSQGNQQYSQLNQQYPSGNAQYKPTTQQYQTVNQQYQTQNQFQQYPTTNQHYPTVSPQYQLENRPYNSPTPGNHRPGQKKKPPIMPVSLQSFSGVQGLGALTGLPDNLNLLIPSGTSSQKVFHRMQHIPHHNEEVQTVPGVIYAIPTNNLPSSDFSHVTSQNSWKISPNTEIRIPIVHDYSPESPNPPGTPNLVQVAPEMFTLQMQTSPHPAQYGNSQRPVRNQHDQSLDGEEEDEEDMRLFDEEYGTANDMELEDEDEDK